MASLEDAHVVDAMARELLDSAPLGSHGSLVRYDLLVTTGAVRGSGLLCQLLARTPAFALSASSSRRPG